MPGPETAYDLLPMASPLLICFLHRWKRVIKRLHKIVR